MLRRSKGAAGSPDGVRHASDYELAEYGAALLQSVQRLFEQRDMNLLGHVCGLAVIEARRFAVP